MIGKQTKGRGFRHLLDYLESRDEAKLIGGNMSARNARELAKEFRLSRQLNPDAERVVYHVSLSAAKGDRLDDEQWREIGDRYSYNYLSKRLGMPSQPPGIVPLLFSPPQAQQ